MQRRNFVRMSQNKPMSHEKSAIKRMTNVGPATTSAKSLSRVQNRLVPHGVRASPDYNPLIPKAVPRTEAPPTPEPEHSPTGSRFQHLSHGTRHQHSLSKGGRKYSVSSGLLPQTPASGSMQQRLDNGDLADQGVDSAHRQPRGYVARNANSESKAKRKYRKNRKSLGKKGHLDFAPGTHARKM